jgi:hypothetical protein
VVSVALFVPLDETIGAAAVAATPPAPLVRDYASAVIGPPPAPLGLDPFYRKHADALGIPVVSSPKAPDAALLVARDILVHEFAHAMHAGIAAADPGLFAEIARAYADAARAGRWRGSYGATNAEEYWAEGVQFWFHSNFEYRDGDRRVLTPDDLLRYDPKLYELVGRVYVDHRIPADVYCGREIPNTSRTGVQNVLE